MTKFNVQQKATIETYRNANNLGFVVTDEYIADLIKKEMETPGVVYTGFENLAKSVVESRIKQTIQPVNSPTNNDSSIFGTQVTNDYFEPFSIEKTTIFPEIQPTESQNEALNFLKDLTNDAETTFKNREDEAGPLSAVVNTWHEILDDQYAKSNVKKDLQAVKEDLKILEQASKGQVSYSDFLGNTYIKSFEDVFKQRRGVNFNEQAIADCADKAEQFATIKTSVEVINQTKQILGYTTKGDVHSQMNPQEASSAIIKAFQLSGINSLDEMNKTLKDVEEKYKNLPEIQKYGGDFRFVKNSQGKYVIYRTAKNGYPTEATNKQLKVIAEEMGLRLDKALATALGIEYSENATAEEMAQITRQTYDKYQKEYEASFAKAYGKKDVKALAEAYVLKQQQGVANIEMALNIASIALMVVPGGVTATSGWLLKSANSLKFAKGVDYVNKAQKFANVASGLQKVQKTVTPFSIGIVTLRPTELLEQLGSKNGMSEEEWEAWGEGVLKNSIYMTTGFGVSKLVQNGVALYKTRALVNSLKSAGKSTDEIMAMIKANPTKFPNDIVKNFSKIDDTAKKLQISLEFLLDIGSTIVLNKVMNNGELLTMDVVFSFAFALMGGVVQKDFARLNGNVDKVNFILKEFKDFGITEADAKNILQAMDDISSGKINTKDIKPIETITKRTELRAKLQAGKKVNSQTEIVIPHVVMEAPRRGFGEKTQDYVNIIKNNSTELRNICSAYLSGVDNIESFVNKFVKFLNDKMDMPYYPEPILDRRLKVMGQFDPSELTVAYSDKNMKRLSELMSTLIHEYHHFLQEKEMICNFSSLDEYIYYKAEAKMEKLRSENPDKYNDPEVYEKEFMEFYNNYKTLYVENPDWKTVINQYPKNNTGSAIYKRGEDLFDGDINYSSTDRKKYYNNIHEKEAHEIGVKTQLEIEYSVLGTIDNRTYNLALEIYEKVCKYNKEYDLPETFDLKCKIESDPQHLIDVINDVNSYRPDLNSADKIIHSILGL